MITTMVAVLTLSFQTPVTATGIPLDAPWKISVYALAKSTFIHPAWGWQHSERNYDLAARLAREEGLTIDRDVLFAAAFLHDMAAFKPCADAKMEHGDCAAASSGKILADAGFPMQKLAAVQTAERTHMYYRDPGSSHEAIVLHDADSLDFLGDVGIARIIALTGAKAPSFAPAITQLRALLKDVPPRLVTKAARRIGAQRAEELRTFLDNITAQTFEAKAM